MDLSVVYLHFILLCCVASTSGFNVNVQDATIITVPGAIGSYFGYSVAIAADTNDRKWVLVGAPRSDDPSMPTVKRPGVVYRCQLVSGGSPSCSILDIDHNTGPETTEFGGTSVTYFNGRDDSWLGGSIAVGSSIGSGFVTCAPKWYNIKSVDDYYMNGMCYQIPLDFNMVNVLKMPVFIDHTVKLVNGINRWDYAFSGLGMSVHYQNASRDQSILIGSPGLLDWIGGFAGIYGGTVNRTINRINTTDFTKPYLGSAISSGRYFSDGITYIATGAPRANMVGMVWFFRSDVQFVYQNAALILQGSDDENKDLPLNAYFGAALCTVDINRDGADDLLVGAPLYSPPTNNKLDEYTDLGLVSVYMGSKQQTRFKTSPLLLKGVEPYGRFGTALESLGDINADSFPDIAIGAPYENNNKGAVYIFNGYTEGLWPKYSQRIQASELNTGLSGFGISISPGKTLNSDTINDVAIGSYLSDEVIVLFGQPVVSLHGELNIWDVNNAETVFVEVDERNKTVQVCVSFSDIRCNAIELNVTTMLDLKEDQSRVKFASNNLRTITDVFRLMNDGPTCTPKNRMIAMPTFDYKTGIVVRADYSVNQMNCPSYEVTPTVSRFDGKNPLDPKLTIQKEVYFRKDCPNNICNSNLTLMVKAVYVDVDGHLVIGTQLLRLDIDITKTGDPTYGSIFHLVYPSFLDYTKISKASDDSDVVCSLLENRNETDTNLPIAEGETGLECLFGNPMRSDKGVRFQIHMRVPSTVTETTMKLNMAVKTSNNEQDPSDNTRTLIIDMKYDVHAGFSGRAVPDTIFVRDDFKSSYDIKHVYELNNKGPSTVVGAHLNISYPSYILDGNTLMYLNTTETKCIGKCEIGCSIENPYPSRPVYEHGTSHQISVSKKHSGELGTVKKLDCTSEKCPVLLCKAHNIQPRQIAVIYLTFVLQNDIKNILGEGATRLFVTDATVQLDETNMISKRTRFNHRLTTTVRHNVIEKKKAEWWIYVVSGLGGLLFIIIIVLILWKVGFFKRKKRDQVREMRKSRAISSINAGVDITPKKTRKESYTDSEGGIIDKEVQPAQSDVQPAQSDVQS